MHSPGIRALKRLDECLAYRNRENSMALGLLMPGRALFKACGVIRHSIPASRFSIHSFVYEKNEDEDVDRTKNAENVTSTTSQKWWTPHPKTGTGSNPAGASHIFGPRSSPNERGSSIESAGLEHQLFGGFNDYDSQQNSFYGEVDRVEKAYRKASSSFGKEDWSGELGWEGDQISLDSDTLNDGMDDKLKKAALEHDYGALRADDDYSFRPDATFTPGTQYKVQDLDLRKPGVQKVFRRYTFQTTSKEALRKADFRNARFLQNFITEAGLLWPRKKFNLSAKAQRKVVREIKTARAFGLLPFTLMGKKSFAFGKTMEDLDEDYIFDNYVANADEIEDVSEIEAQVLNEDLDIPDLGKR